MNYDIIKFENVLKKTESRVLSSSVPSIEILLWMHGLFMVCIIMFLEIVLDRNVLSCLFEKFFHVSNINWSNLSSFTKISY